MRRGAVGSTYIPIKENRETKPKANATLAAMHAAADKVTAGATIDIEWGRWRQRVVCVSVVVSPIYGTLIVVCDEKAARVFRVVPERCRLVR